MSWRAWLAFASLDIIWGVPYFFIKLAVQELSPFVVVCGSLLIATAIMLPGGVAAALQLTSTTRHNAVELAALVRQAADRVSTRLRSAW